MAYQAPYSGLAQLMEMQGRRGDSMLVHMNPMEVRMLEAMSPDGSLSTNPDTGLPEAFKLKDILGVALPIAGAALLGPAIAPALGVSGLTGAAIGTGLGGFGAGLAQGKNFKDSLVQGGISGLMSYGLGSLSGAFAPSGGVTAATPDLGTGISDSLTGAAIDPNMELVASSTGTTAAAAEAPSLFTQLGNMASTPVMPETMSSVLGPEKLAAAQFAEAMPTYGSLAGAGLSGAMAAPVGQGLGLMAPDEMPYDIADMYDMYDMDAYYASRIPDLRLGRLRGQAAARSLNYPPSGGTAADYYSMATSPGGFGTFYAADGGQVPKPYGDPYGSGDPYNSMSDESSSEQSSSTGPGMSLGSFNEPVADLGLGSFNPTPMSLGLTALGMVPGPIGMMANIANIGRGLVGIMGPSAPGQVTGFGTTTGGPTGIGIGVTGQAVDPDFEAVSEGYGGTGMGGEDSGSGDQGDTGVGHGAGEGTSEEGAADYAQGGVVEAGIGGLLKALSPAALATDTLGIADVDKLKTKDMLGMLSPAAFFAKDPKRLKYLSPAYMASQKPSALSPAATVMMNRGMAQGGGISSLAYGGDPAPIGFANKAFEGMVPGPGTGMSDDVPFSIEGNQPALLSRDEYVLPADVVSQLGDGSSSAGADMLDNFISQVRQTKYGNTQQPAPVGPQLMTGLMKQGGVV